MCIIERRAAVGSTVLHNLEVSGSNVDPDTDYPD
jgi:hypothetical protein